MKLLGPDIDIPQQNIVGDDALDKSGLVVLFFIVGLGAVEGHCGHGAYHAGRIVLPACKGCIIKLRAPPCQRFERIAVKGHQFRVGLVDRFDRSRPLLSNTGQFIASYHRSLRINHADGTVGTVLHLQNHTLENPAGHRFAPFYAPAALNLSTPRFFSDPAFLLYWFFSPFSIGKTYFFVKNAEGVHMEIIPIPSISSAPPPSEVSSLRSPIPGPTPAVP